MNDDIKPNSLMPSVHGRLELEEPLPEAEVNISKASSYLASVRKYKILFLLMLILASGIGIELLSLTLLEDFLKIHPILSGFLTLLSHAFTTAAVIGIVYDLLTRRELIEYFDTNLNDLENAFTKTARTQSKAILDSLPLILINPIHVRQLISRTTAKELLPILIERASGSPDVEEAFSQTISSQFDRQGVTWRGLRHSLSMRPMAKDEWMWRNSEDYMELRDQMSYKTTIRTPLFTCVCCKVWDDYIRYEFNPDYNSVWLMPGAFRSGQLEGETDAFVIENFRVNDRSIEGTRSYEIENAITYSFKIPDSFINMEARISYRVHTVLRKKSHLYKIRVTDLTKGMSVRADIDQSLAPAIKALDYFPKDVGAVTDNADDRLSVEVTTDDWVFPGQGVAIIWE